MCTRSRDVNINRAFYLIKNRFAALCLVLPSILSCFLAEPSTMRCSKLAESKKTKHAGRADLYSSAISYGTTHIIASNTRT